MSQAGESHAGHQHDLGPLVEEPENVRTFAKDPWKSKNLLSFDGGGVRGLWSLFLLEKLMEYVQDYETSYFHDSGDWDEQRTCSSFHPFNLPNNVSHVESEDKNETPGTHQCCQSPWRQRFLPCHYFDYISGSSTGALIAIMLGRLRMTVSDCIMEYTKLGGQVFGNPRKVNAMTFPFPGFKRTKYNTENFEKIIQNLISRRLPKSSVNTFEFDSDLCRTVVTTYKKGSIDTDLFLMRTYIHRERMASMLTSRANTAASTTQPRRRPTDSSTRVPAPRGDKRKINYGPAAPHEIWEVARAASAPALYFRSMQLFVDTKEMEFEDGGMGQHNNPTREALLDIEEQSEWNLVNHVVSIGTSRKFKSRKDSTRHTVKRVIDRSSDPEMVHKLVDDLARQHEFAYSRFNAAADGPHALDTEFDEWKPRSGPAAGQKTIAELRTKFGEWAGMVRNLRFFESCARSLVDLRHDRVRADRARWERFALCHRFTCRRDLCANQPNDRNVFGTRDVFEKHLIENHGFMRNHSLETEITQCKTQWDYPPRATT